MPSMSLSMKPSGCFHNGSSERFLRAGALRDKATAVEKRSYYATDAERLQAAVTFTEGELFAMSANSRLSDFHLKPVDACAWQVMLSPGSRW